MELLVAGFLVLLVGYLVRYAQELVLSNEKMKQDYENGFKDGYNAGCIDTLGEINEKLDSRI